jgi:alkanesulfonate monooxygenase SsuD/methylene tetrahydromethanopterin reductase-like flavin-dependent oxidoreductase (luciferase family)
MSRLGVIAPPWFPPEQLRGAVAAAEESGVDQLWLWEDCFSQSGIASAAAALAWSQRLEVGVGLLPVPLRNVALTAMEIATIDRTFPGRFHAVLGHGVQSWMGQAGARVASPLTLLQEYLEALRALLAGQTVTVDGTYVQLDGVALRWPPTTPPPVLAGATGERTLAMLAGTADGVLIDFGVSPEQLRRTLGAIGQAAAAAGRPAPRALHYAYGATGPAARERLAEVLGDWSDDPDRRRGAAGDAADIADAVNRWFAAGAETVVLRPLDDEPDLEGYVRFVGERVRPLLG